MNHVTDGGGLVLGIEWAERPEGVRCQADSEGESDGIRPGSDAG